MTRKISFFAIAILIFSMATVASANVLTLTAEVPEGKTLRAYTLVIPYTGKIAEKGIQTLGFTINANDVGGEIIVNGMDAKGLKGGKTAKIIKVKFEGSGKIDVNNIVTKSCGSSSADQYTMKFTAK